MGFFSYTILVTKVQGFSFDISYHSIIYSRGKCELCLNSNYILGNSVRLYFLGSKITADGDFSHEIKRLLLLGRQVLTNLDSILKSRDITLSTKVHLVKAIVFPVVISGCESWMVKKAERQRIDSFEVRCWRRLLRVPWTARRSN